MEVHIYGPPASGKTMLAEKLEKFLKMEGYAVKRLGEHKGDGHAAEVLTVLWYTCANPPKDK